MVKDKVILGLKTIGMLLWLSIMTGCEEDKTNLVYQLNQPDELAEEVYQVYSRVINKQFENQDYLIIQQETDTGVHRQHCNKLYESDTTDLDSTTIGNYLTNNRDSYNLGSDFKTDIEVKLITREEYEAYEGMDGFHDNYPEANGLILFTHPGFNSNTTRALFEYTRRTGDDTKEHYMVYLKKTEKEWNIVYHELITDT